MLVDLVPLLPLTAHPPRYRVFLPGEGAQGLIAGQRANMLGVFGIGQEIRCRCRG